MFATLNMFNALYKTYYSVRPDLFCYFDILKKPWRKISKFYSKNFEYFVIELALILMTTIFSDSSWGKNANLSIAVFALNVVDNGA